MKGDVGMSRHENKKIRIYTKMVVQVFTLCCYGGKDTGCVDNYYKQGVTL